MRKNLFFIFFSICFTISIVNAQTTSNEINGGSTSYAVTDAFPLDPYYNYNYCQAIYPASDLTGGGISGAVEISSIMFYYDNDAGNEAEYDDWVIYLGNTSKSSWADADDWVPTSSMSQVFNGTVSFPAVDNWLTIDLDNAFVWDGVSNLVIAVDENSPGYESNVTIWRSTSTASTANTVIYYSSDLTNPDPSSPPSADGYTWDWRAILKLKYTACTSASTYYSKSSGDLDDLSTWGTEIDGTGCPPANFTTAGVTYYVHNNTAPTTSGTWTVSGSGSKVVVGDVDNTVVFTAGAALDFDCDLELAEDGTLNLNDNNMNLEGDLIRSNASAVFNPGPSGTNTVTFDGGTDQYINVTAAGGSTPSNADLTFYDVVVTNGSTVRMYYKFTNSKKLNINDLTVDSGNTLHFISD
jgi:hypothetical protein